MASPRQLPLRHLFLLLVAAASAFLATVVIPAAAAQEGYSCRDSLAGLKECESFMYGGAAAPSAACCAAYEAAFDADPFCLCYVADGTYGRATGYDVDVAHGLQIPARCGQGQPPVELCNMEGLVLPPYTPQDTTPPAQRPAAADAPTNAQPPSASGSSLLPVAPPTFTSPPPPSSEAPDLLPEFVVLLAVAIVMLNCI
ncbi:non-specific lipid transfer protein GPI-anchored 2 [Sorghum bicolor]|nr:non-specific lipid transfer protein GPI-anchored 2 [Sorghum bicolor]|eukprot:XP_021317798.1 non-specific lipid transfer protein GPI-anchored 2 [Sorghum bicolor]